MKILGWDPVASLKIRRIACSGTSSSSVSGSYLRINKNDPAQECCKQGSFVLVKQLFWKIPAKWKQYRLRRQQKVSAVNFSYDQQSYLQNFDSGRPLDRPSPFVP